MKQSGKSDEGPVAEVANARRFYAGLGMDSHYFSALWHTFNVGHMLSVDLDRVCRGFLLSVADFNLMGALRIDHPRHMRATDLAITLQVSNSALTSRVAKLTRAGLLVRTSVSADRRAFALSLTPPGVETVDAIHAEISRSLHFVREVDQLENADREALERIMGELHGRLARYFVHAHR